MNDGSNDGATHELPHELPLVSAVIPTRNRPSVVLRAVESALNQTYPRMEVVVVIDGSDPDTELALVSVNDPRLKVVPLAESVGGSEARNTGAGAASGEWIALLDDDDEWREDKIRKQVDCALATHNPYVLVFSRMTVRHIGKEEISPRRLPAKGEPMSEYLYCRKGIAFGEGFLQTSSFFASRDMFMEVPFRKGQQRFQDADWLLRACAHPHAEIEVLPEPLVTYYMDQVQAVSRKSDWEYLYRWASDNRALFTRRAYSFFLATQCVPRAAIQNAPFSTFLLLLKEVLFAGRASFTCLKICLVFWFVPVSVRQNVRDTLARWRSGAVVTPQATSANEAN